MAEGNFVSGLTIGVDKKLVTLATFDRLARTFGEAGAKLVGTDNNPIDTIWQDRPSPPAPAPFRLDAATAGTTMSEKLQQLDTALQGADCTAIFLSRVDSVNWLTNIRGRDLPCTPVMQAYALYHRENGLILIAKPGRLAAVMTDDLATDASVVPLTDFASLLGPEAGYASGTKVMIEAASLPKSLHDILDGSAVELVRRACPVMHAKAAKNEAEQEGTRRAHIEDGASMVRFLSWLETVSPGQIQETEIAAHLLSIRRKTQISSPPVSRPSAGRDQMGRLSITAPLRVPTVRLSVTVCCWWIRVRITPVARPTLPVPLRSAPPAMRCATRLPASSRDISPWHVPAFQQTAQASRSMFWHVGPLWAEGLDYAHGTGHGVGHIMQVHEGPASLSKRGTERLVAGMLLSNEPGYYKQGEWGIRIENLIIINPPDDAGFLSFETVTHCPIDKRLVVIAMLNEAERAWLDAYHSQVEALLLPLLDGDEVDAGLVAPGLRAALILFIN